MEERFKRAEEEYFRLKGELALGRIARDKFEAALKDLMVQDTQGRYWMLGADSGKWYVHDGSKWVEMPPPTVDSAANASAAPFAAVSAPPPAYTRPLPPPYAPAAPFASPLPYPAIPAAPASPRSGIAPVVLAIGAAVVVLCLAAVALLVAAGTGVVRLGLPGTPTSIALVLPTVSIPTLPPLPSAPPPTVQPTRAPATPAPPTTTPIKAPTVAPTAPPAPTIAPAITALPASTSAPTSIPTATATRVVPPTPVPSPTASFPPGVYVQDVKTEPAQVLNGQNPTFVVTFLNTLGADAEFSNWYIRIFEPDKRNAFGETSRQPIKIPQGTSTYSSQNNWKASGNAQCRPFQAHISYIDKNTDIQDFPNTRGELFLYYFTVCE